MNISPVQPGFIAIRAAADSIKRSEELLLNAVEEVNRGDIVDAALLTNRAVITAKCGVAVAKAANEISETLMDIFA